MTCKPLRVLTSLLLSAIMLTGGSGLLSFCHSHADGDQAHHHHDHAAHQIYDPHAFDHHDDVHASNLMEAAVAHVHFLWFGFGFSLPLDSEEDDEDQPARFLALGCSQQIATVESSFAETALHQQAALAPFAVVVEQQFRGATSQVLAPPLCAKARQERSGVQLI